MKDESITTIAIRVGMAHGQQEKAGQRAQEAATKQLANMGLGAPIFLYENGIPDLRIVLEGGKVAALYYRNSEMPPTVTVSDLDYSDSPEKDGGKLLRILEGEGYEFMPFLEAPV